MRFCLLLLLALLLGTEKPSACVRQTWHACYIPNAFTPNTTIGLNDEFYPVGEDIASFTMQIFSRWRKCIFTSRPEMDRWNGRVDNKGDLVPEGTYIYVIEVLYKDGQKEKFVGSFWVAK